MNGEKQRAVTATERILGCALRDVTPLGNDERRNLVLRATTPSRPSSSKRRAMRPTRRGTSSTA
jgi:hypothetical protein